MANIQEILQKGIRFGAVRMVRGKQIDEVASRVITSGIVTRELLEQIGREIAGDSLLFNEVDVDGLNQLLVRIKKPQVMDNQSRHP